MPGLSGKGLAGPVWREALVGSGASRWHLAGRQLYFHRYQSYRPFCGGINLSTS
jgi:hypothetical protein